MPNWKGGDMKTGARNSIQAKVLSIKSDEIMSLVKFEVTTPHEMSSVLTTESVKDMNLKVGDSLLLVVKAIHVLPIKE
jgi:molybdopterin-binding protein